MLIPHGKLAAGTLLLSLGTVALRYYHTDLKFFSVCEFAGGMCQADNQVFLAEGRLNVSSINSTSTST